MNTFVHRENCPGIQNPDKWPVSSETFYNPEVYLGQFFMNSSQLEQWNGWKNEDMNQISAFISQNSMNHFQQNGWLYLTSKNDGYVYSRMQ